MDMLLSHRLGLSTDFTDSNNNSDSSDMGQKGDKYSLRPRSVRRRNNNYEENNEEGLVNVKQNKPKQKSAPLSKYRRKTANARERSRMREINQAFETLRRAVPQMSAHTGGNNEKLTKITTLRLAMKYISTLSAVLTKNSNGDGTHGEDILISDCSDLDLLLESDGESLPLNSDFSDHSLASDFTVDFSPLSPDFTGHLTHFDPFLSDFS